MKAIRTKKETIERRAAMREYLEKMVTRGASVYTIMHRVSASGINRYFSVLVVSDGAIADITPTVACVCEFTYKLSDTNADAIEANAAIEIVHELARRLFGNYRELNHIAL